MQKSFARLSFNDFKANPDDFTDTLQSSFAQVELEDSYFNKDVEKAFMDASKVTFESKTEPSLLIAKNVGNMYTPSLYGGLVSFIVSHESVESLVGKRVALFSYGSGSASSFFSIRVSHYWLQMNFWQNKNEKSFSPSTIFSTWRACLLFILKLMLFFTNVRLQIL